MITPVSYTHLDVYKRQISYYKNYLTHFYNKIGKYKSSVQIVIRKHSNKSLIIHLLHNNSYNNY